MKTGKSILFSLIALPFIMSSSEALACSCTSHKNVSEILEDDPVIVMATPVDGFIDERYPSFIIPNKIKIDKIYVGNSAAVESIKAGFGNCSIYAKKNMSMLFVAHRNNAGILESGHCSYGMLGSDEIIEFLETGKDRPSAVFCKNAYAELIFTKMPEQRQTALDRLGC